MAVELALTQAHFETVEWSGDLPGLCLEIFAEATLDAALLGDLSAAIRQAWPVLMRTLSARRLYDELPVDLRGKLVEVELVWTDNPAIQGLNRDYRSKDVPTDVLTFSLIADAPDPAIWAQLPVLSLGTIFISVPYAQAALAETPGVSLARYLLERYLHGMLHLLGQHHDTMADYRRVVDIQQQVLNAVFASGA